MAPSAEGTLQQVAAASHASLVPAGAGLPVAVCAHWLAAGTLQTVVLSCN